MNHQNHRNIYQAPNHAPHQHNNHAPAQAQMTNHSNANDHGFNQQAYFEQPPQNDFPHYQNNQMVDAPKKPGLQRQEGFLQLKSHGGSCAMQLETTQTRDDWFTATIESAPKDQSDPNKKRFDWKSKTTLQLTKNELPVFIAVTLGMLPSVRFANHGNENKFLEIENQSKHFFFKTGGSGLKMHTTPVPIQEAYMFATLALNQYVKNFPSLTHDAAINIISRMANQMFTSAAFTPASSANKPR